MRHPLLLTALWILAAFVINPIGEFPVNDDWAYAKNVYHLAVNHEFRVDLWPAMNLVSQTLYGSAWVVCFGFSFTILRISMLFLAWTASLVLYRILCRIAGGNKTTALFLTVTFCFGVIFLNLSFSFMTDIFFLSFMIFSIWSILKYREGGKKRYYFLFLLFCLVAMLDRQHGLLIPILAVGPVIITERKPAMKFLLSALPFFLCYYAGDEYRQLLNRYGISHSINNSDELKAHLAENGLSFVPAFAGDMLLVAGWMLLPVALLQVLVNAEVFKRNWPWLICLSGIACFIVYQAWSEYPVGNVFRFPEAGPRVIQGWRPPGADGSLAAPKFVYTLFSFLSLCVSLFYIFRKDASGSMLSSNGALRISFAAFLASYFILIVIFRAYFDRYALPLALVWMILLVPGSMQLTSGKKWILGVTAAMIFVFSVMTTRDLFSWHRTRQQATEWLHAKGLDAHSIDGGFEYNGWHKPSQDYSQPPKSWWWVDRDDYVIAAAPLEGFQTDTLFTVHRLLPYGTDTILVLRNHRH